MNVCLPRELSKQTASVTSPVESGRRQTRAASHSFRRAFTSSAERDNADRRRALHRFKLDFNYPPNCWKLLLSSYFRRRRRRMQKTPCDGDGDGKRVTMRCDVPTDSVR